MFGVSMLGSGLLGIAIERFAYGRSPRAPVRPLISALGVSFFLQQIAVLLFGSIPKSWTTPAACTTGCSSTPSRSAPSGSQYVQYLVILSAVALMVASRFW